MSIDLVNWCGRGFALDSAVSGPEIHREGAARREENLGRERTARSRTRLPPIAQVRRTFRQPEVEDVAGAMAQAIRGSRLRERVAAGRPGRDHGRQPRDRRDRADRPGGGRARSGRWDSIRSSSPRWAATAAARAEGQRALLAELGVTEDVVGCPIRSEMETVVLGTNSFGLPIHFDRNAHEADGIVLLNRIKPHTSFTGRYESGLLKMLTIGLGKRQGAAQVHKLGLPGLRAMLPEVGAFLLERTRVVLGVGDPRERRASTRRGSSPSSPRSCWKSSRGCSTSRGS